MIDAYTLSSRLLCGVYFVAGWMIGHRAGVRRTTAAIFQLARQMLDDVWNAEPPPSPLARETWRGQPRKGGRFTKVDQAAEDEATSA